jgi:hypothetical protein
VFLGVFLFVGFVSIFVISVFALSSTTSQAPSWTYGGGFDLGCGPKVLVAECDIEEEKAVEAGYSGCIIRLRSSSGDAVIGGD